MNLKTFSLVFANEKNQWPSMYKYIIQNVVGHVVYVCWCQLYYRIFLVQNSNFCKRFDFKLDLCPRQDKKQNKLDYDSFKKEYLFPPKKMETLQLKLHLYSHLYTTTYIYDRPYFIALAWSSYFMTVFYAFLSDFFIIIPEIHFLTMPRVAPTPSVRF